MGEAFKKMEPLSGDETGWLINDKYKVKLVVGAGGHYCPLARAIDSKGINELAVVAQEAEFEMNVKQK